MFLSARTVRERPHRGFDCACGNKTELDNQGGRRDEYLEWWKRQMDALVVQEESQVINPAVCSPCQSLPTLAASHGYTVQPWRATGAARAAMFLAPRWRIVSKNVLTRLKY